ncbi:hypothetical protein, variant 1 [Cryptococcus amylolentus CBS 6039]|uniref:Fungal-type protein kinase domain-containing protein n=2 Tax=Cryptococcus amylolentus TaxID=104669 RepID=A0A1E3HR30_9TREE|nr:hypothetical protein L202_04368 [Cryptococcus amylolentus CBS 6039]XP_018993866.1 hypothetical protein, variant 1 [Cryptococcus amylolentus CBS 6039]ODN78819.1 hypothetical protein L202_04368 [Cryptococcus amylolentus CBS 6039]ODN78820.1 hypothetical protein, variant 1 [Cryptococcus amylolentus CBS 6039]
MSFNGTNVEAAIGEMDMAGIYLTHVHNLKDQYQYTRFWRLLTGMYCSPIDDAGCNRRIRFYSNEAGNMVLEKWSYAQKAWRCVEKRLCNRNNFWSRTTRVDALHPAGSEEITEYESARRAPLEEGAKKRKKEEDTIPQPAKRGRSGQSSTSFRREDATDEPDRPKAAPEQGSDVAVSSPLFNHEDIQRLKAPLITVIVESSTAIEHKVETDIYNPITRHKYSERQVYQFLEKVLGHNQSMRGIAQFASRRTGRPTRAVGCVVGGEKFYRNGLEDSDESCASNDLLRDVTKYLDLDGHLTPDSYYPRRASSVKPKPVIPRIETVQETVTLGVTLFDVYQKHKMLGLVKAILGALHGYRNLLRGGWLHRDISVNNIVVGSTKGFEPCDYDQDGGRAVPTAYSSDCLIDDKDGELCGMLIDFDLAVLKGRNGGTAKDDKAFLTGTMNFMATAIFRAHDEIADGEEIPSAHSPIFDLESFFWVLIYVPLYCDTQGDTPNTRDVSIFRSLFGSFPASVGNRDSFLARKGSGYIDDEECCLAPLENLLTELMDLVDDYYKQSLRAMKGKAGQSRKAENIGNSRKTTKGGKGGKGTNMMCPWNECEENMAVEKFIDILSGYVREQV